MRSISLKVKMFQDEQDELSEKCFFSHLFFLTFLGEISVMASKKKTKNLQDDQFFALELWKARGHDGSRQF